MSERGLIRVISFVLSGFAVMGGFILQERASAEGYMRQNEITCLHAFAELDSAADMLGTSLGKCVRLSSTGAFSTACTEAYAKAQAASGALGALPFSDAELSRTAELFSVAGDYAYALMKKAASGYMPTDEEMQNLEKLSDCAETLSDNLSELYGELESGSITLLSAEKKADSSATVSLCDSFISMESEFPELPSLIYDGPFSEHLTGRAPVMLEGAPEITEEEAISRISEFTGLDSERFKVEYRRDGAIPVYVLSAHSLHGEMVCEVSVAGGVVTRVKNTRKAGESIISAADGVMLAERFIAARGYDSMDTSYYYIEDGCITVNLAYSQNGVMCYPDLAKVTVALDTGGIVGFENEGYVMSHRKREILKPEVSAADAKSRVSPGLTVLSDGLAVIETSGKNEVLCHEFKCEDKSGTHYILYVNAETGAEEKLLLLIEDDNGTLTI